MQVHAVRQRTTKSRHVYKEPVRIFVCMDVCIHPETTLPHQSLGDRLKRGRHDTITLTCSRRDQVSRMIQPSETMNRLLTTQHTRLPSDTGGTQKAYSVLRVVDVAIPLSVAMTAGTGQRSALAGMAMFTVKG